MVTKDGFIILDNELLIEKEPLGIDKELLDYKWFYIKDREYLFKQESLKDACTEIFCMLVAKHLNVSTVEYALAQYNGRMGVLTATYNPNFYKEYPLAKILSCYCKASNGMNLENIWDALNFYYQDCENKVWLVQSLMNDIVTAFLFQNIIGNTDLHSYNLVFLEQDKNHVFLAPNFDYNYAGCMNFHQSIVGQEFQLLPFPYQSYFDRTGINPLLSFLNASDISYTKKFLDMVLQMPSRVSVLQEIEFLFHTKMSEEFKATLMRNYDSYQDLFLKILEGKDRSLCKKKMGMSY